MVKTPPYQKRGKCGHFMPQFDSHGSCFSCRAKCKGQDPCAQGADTTQCSACASLTEEQWSHLRESFAKRSAYRHKTGSQGDSFEELEKKELVLTVEDFSRVDDTLLDLEPEDSGTSHWHHLTSLPAALPAQNVLVTSFTMGLVQQSMTDSSALFKAPHPLSQTVTQDILPSFIYLGFYVTFNTVQAISQWVVETSGKGRGNQYIQFVRVLYCKLPTNGKQLAAFPLEAMAGIEPRPQRW